MKSESIWIVGERQMEIRSVDIGDPGYGQVQVNIKACGVCCWDSYLYRGQSALGPMPYMIGHEGVGVVAKAGPGVKAFREGDIVFCSGGSNAQMSEYVNVEQDCIARISQPVGDFASWVLEPTVTVVNVLTWTAIEPGDRVVLIGAGYMGQLTLMGLTRAYPCGAITVFETREDRLAMAKQYGPTYAFNPGSDEGRAHIDRIVEEGGADRVIEFSAADSGYELALKLVRRPAGRLTIGSWHRHEMRFDGTDWHMNGLIVNNVSPSTTVHYNDLVPRTGRLVERGVFAPGRLVTHTAHYSDCQWLFERAIDKEDGYIKGVVRFA